MELPPVIELNGAVIIEIPPQLTLLNAQGVNDRWNEHIGRRPRLIALHCGAVVHVDSMGISCLVRFLQSADRYAIPLLLVGASDALRAVMQVAEVDSLFTHVGEKELAERCAERPGGSAPS